MNTTEFRELMLKEFPYSPTQGQEELIRLLGVFVTSTEQQFPFFLLEGYAGTGKTTIVSLLVRVLPALGYQPVLLAPTGRAAKVLSNYSGHPAYTLHKHLYFAHMDSHGSIVMKLRPNTLANAIFIVDEASMIPEDHPDPSGTNFRGFNLLEDLVQHVYTGQNCRLLFLGDDAQLPPVGSSQSPALNSGYLKNSFFLDLVNYKLTDVVRQSLESGILNTATSLRQKLGNATPPLPLFGKENQYADVISIKGDEMMEAIYQAYSDFGRENTVVITRSNKRANLYNQAIRQRILFHDNEISAGDHLMVVKNNYFWLPEDSKAGFIANGDLIEIQRIRRLSELYGFHFAETNIRLVDYPDEPSLDVILLLDTLKTETPSLSQEENLRLYNCVLADYEEIKNKRKKLASVRTNPHFNALQVKHSYALTCHKTQGGQWDVVFLEKGYLKEEYLDEEYLKWLYTAITRASKRLYLVNYDHRFFS